MIALAALLALTLALNGPPRQRPPHPHARMVAAAEAAQRHAWRELNLAPARVNALITRTLDELADRRTITAAHRHLLRNPHTPAGGRAAADVLRGWWATPIAVHELAGVAR